MVWKLDASTIQLITFVIQGLFKNSVLRRHVCIVFWPNQPIRVSELINCSRYGWTVKPKHCYWLFGRENNTHLTRDDEELHFCINLDKNIDNESHYTCAEFPNHLTRLTMTEWNDNLAPIFEAEIDVECQPFLLFF